MKRLALLLTLAVGLAAPVRALDPDTLPAVGYHPGGLAYWDTPFFANALQTGAQWIEYAEGQWGNTVASWGNPQFDANGFPRYLNPGLKLRAITFGLHCDYGNRPPTWPVRHRLAQGRVVLTWKGDADIRLNGGGTYLSAQSSGAATGRLSDGRRVYRFDGGNYLQFLEVQDVNSSAPVTDIRVWLSDPADPANASLENQLFHPTFLARLGDANWGFIRFMNWQETNANPQRDWSDRRPPSHCYAGGPLNPRAPATGFGGNRGSGAAFEHMVALCNAANKDMWVCVPHLATDDFVTRMAKLIRYGSDGVNPYDAPTSNPVWAPLAPHLRVFVEYSNEIWSNGNSFPQGNWAEEQATTSGITKAQFNARRFCLVWRLFHQVFSGGGEARLVRVAAVFTAADWYTRPFLQEMAAYGPSLSPPVEPDVIAATTYFGNGMQDWAHDRALVQASLPDRWFYTGATFDAGGGNLHPVMVPATDPYWTSMDVNRHLDETLAEWMRRLLAGDAREGAGPDAVGIGGGFDTWLRDLARTAFPAPKPLIAYEGGPSIYTDNRDWGDSRDDGLTAFMEAMNRRPGMAAVYRVHLEMARSKGLRSHVGFTDCSSWGKYGQWGHLEHLDQPPTSSVKYAFLLDWAAQVGTQRHVDAPAGSVPGFVTAHNLPVCVVGEPYLADVVTSGGDGTRVLTVLGSTLAPGLAVAAIPGFPDRVRISGTATAGANSYVFCRVNDADGDPAWRTFTVRAVGGPGTLVESDFTGVNPARSLPWTPAYVRAPGLAYSGWSRGGGVIAQDGDNALVWSVNAPADEAPSTLGLAIADGEYLSTIVSPPTTATLDLRGREVRFTIRRLDYHAPRRYAVFTSISGFANGTQVHTTARDGGTDDQEVSFLLPDTAAYTGITGPVEFRIVGFSGQYGGHKTSLVAFKLYGGLAVPIAGIPDWGMVGSGGNRFNWRKTLPRIVAPAFPVSAPFRVNSCSTSPAGTLR